MSQLVKKIRTDQGDLQIDYNALANLPTISNPNLLINGDFRNPVNQRGKKVYEFISGWTYTVDRWRIFNNMTVTVNDTGTITLAKNHNEQTHFMQMLERRDVPGEYTLSFKVKSMTGTMSAYIEDGNSALVTVTQPGIYEVHTSARANGATFRLEGTNTSVELEWVKLEAGHTATPFVPRLYAEEVALCQRYYESRTIIFIPIGGTSPYYNYVAVNGGQHLVEMRITPNVVIGSLYDENGAESNVTVKANTRNEQSFRSISLNDTDKCAARMLRGIIAFDAEIY